MPFWAATRALLMDWLTDRETLLIELLIFDTTPLNPPDIKDLMEFIDDVKAFRIVVNEPVTVEVVDLICEDIEFPIPLKDVPALDFIEFQMLVALLFIEFHADSAVLCALLEELLMVEVTPFHSVCALPLMFPQTFDATDFMPFQAFPATFLALSAASLMLVLIPSQTVPAVDFV